ncbi:TonB-dependent receptor [Aliikangiella coralliicola]|uniref:TonB-dependent receptor n=1 Tax=Aliikangiella coralliicola TaxID=2592383 RepID=A0A545TW47_9GAMM|nr:TonB-dependent receptor [Aliikangiella coralliicola]TQV81440.1 hypothetical protein FLL46_25145 [Aliikangiella coralliicola]
MEDAQVSKAEFPNKKLPDLFQRKLITLLIGSALGLSSYPHACANEEEAEEEYGHIVVTASRREQSVLDVPYNISVLEEDTLKNAGVSSLNDLLKVVPGLSSVDSGPAIRGGNNRFTLRGLRLGPPSGTTEINTPATLAGAISTYYGETPIFIPLMIRDLERVELLKGPQGTLYGSGSLAGTIRFIPNSPDFESSYSELSFGVGSTHSADNLNHTFDSIFNLPLTDKLALRLNLSYERLGGFIDAVGLNAREAPNDRLSPVRLAFPSDPYSAALVTGEKNTNNSKQWQTRASLLWKATDDVDIQVDYFHNETDVDDQQLSNPLFTATRYDFAQGSNFPSSNTAISLPDGGDLKSLFLTKQPYNSKADLISAEATVDFGLASFKSISSAYQNKTFGVTDFTSFFFLPVTPTSQISFLSYYSFYPRHNSVQQVFSEEEAFIQEIRVISDWDKSYDYVLGFYYNDQSTKTKGTSYSPGIHAFTEFAIGPVLNPQLVDITSINNRDYDFTDQAIFGELTWHINSDWQVTSGIRSFKQELTFQSLELQPLFTLPQDASNFDVTNKFDDTVFKLNTSYRLAEHNLFYALLSEGFRRGGVNGLNTQGPFASLPERNVFVPDVATNFEVGIKGLMPDWSLFYNFSLFNIEVEDLQFLDATPAGFTAAFNAGDARSKGAEFDFSWNATDAISLALSYTYTDMQLTETTEILDLPFGGGPNADPVVALSLPKGTRAPGVPKQAISLGLDYEIPWWGENKNWTVNFHLSGIYKESSPGAADVNSNLFWQIPASFVANARLAIDNGDSWRIELFGNNINDERVFSGGYGVQNVTPWFGQHRYVNRPATFGITFYYFGF